MMSRVNVELSKLNNIFFMYFALLALSPLPWLSARLLV